MKRLAAATVATASALFVGTNLDDILVLAVLNVSSCADGRPTGWQIWTGQHIGIALLVGVSLLGALGLTLLPENRTWLLGSVPLGVGVYKLIAAARARTSGARDSHAVVTGCGRRCWHHCRQRRRQHRGLHACLPHQ
jgi:cadmium resistance protein CadD (predicted permease)